MKSLPLLIVSSLMLAACSSDKDKAAQQEVLPSSETGQQISQHLQKPLDDANNVENVLQQDKQNIDQQLEQQNQQATPDDGTNP